MHVIVPVKSLALAKSRLGTMLDPSERRALALAMLEDVLCALRATSSVDRIGVVSRDPVVQRAARRHGVDLFDDRADDLNGALTSAAGRYTAQGAEAILALHADLPRVAPVELSRFAEELSSGAQVVLAPARDGGTNGVAMRAPLAMPLLFGGRSLERHLAAARERGLRVALIRERGLERDIDRPEDLIWLLEDQGESIAQRLVRRWGIIERVACV
jgi:2-phospho-L-lactate/phosphoenolpyruvate guanylyltransferase